MNIAFIGLGKMGSAMALNLLKAGRPLCVYNRSADKAESLRQSGASVASSPAEAVKGAEVVITMLADDHAVEEVVYQASVLEALPSDAVHVSMSTIGPATSRKLEQAHEKAGKAYVVATVFGRPEAAAAAKLFVVTAGDEAQLKRLAPVFAALGQKTFYMGADPIRANVVKLGGNFLIASIIESLGESTALVRKYGVAPAEYIRFLTESLFAAPVFKTYGEIIAKEDYFSGAFGLRLGMKDIRLVQESAEAAAVPMPVAAAIKDRFVTAMATGYAEADWSALAAVAAEQSGLSVAKRG